MKKLNKKIIVKVMMMKSYRFLPVNLQEMGRIRAAVMCRARPIAHKIAIRHSRRRRTLLAVRKTTWRTTELLKDKWASSNPGMALRRSCRTTW